MTGPATFPPEHPLPEDVYGRGGEFAAEIRGPGDYSGPEAVRDLIEDSHETDGDSA